MPVLSKDKQSVCVELC